MSLKIRVHESVETLEQIMAAADYENRGLDKKKLDDCFSNNLEHGYTHTPFDPSWGGRYFFYTTYITRPSDPVGVRVYVSLSKDEDTGKSQAYLELWDRNGNELCEPVENVALSGVFDAIKSIGK